MTRWPYLVMAVAAVLFVLTACAPSPPPLAWYDANTDVIHYDDATMTEVAAEWGQAGVDWIEAHEQGHSTMMQVWRTRHVALWTLMPGATAAVQIEQLAQCLAAASGAVQPWTWDEAAVAAGYWDCDQVHVELVEEAS